MLKRALASDENALGGTPAFLHDPDDYLAATLSLRTALGIVDANQVLDSLLLWLRGSSPQRRGAQKIIRVVGQIQVGAVEGVLVALSADPRYGVRAASAASLMNGMGSINSAASQSAVFAAAREAGCLVPISVAKAIGLANPDWNRRQELIDELSNHMSASVRLAAINSRRSG